MFSTPAAIAKYGKGQATDDLPTAVAMLVERNILPNLVPGAMLSSNAFRTDRLYHEEVSPCVGTCRPHATLIVLSAFCVAIQVV